MRKTKSFRSESYYLPFIVEIVNKHPEGISADEVYRLLWADKKVLAGMSEDDWAPYGSNPCPRCKQIARNIISNKSYVGYFEIVSAKPYNLYFPIGSLYKAEVFNLNKGTSIVNSSGDEKFFEGVKVKRQIFRRGRSDNLKKAVKQENKNMYEGTSTCECCGCTDEKYSIKEDERSVLEVHHKYPLEHYPDEGKETTVSDCCVLCPTCHTLTHIFKIYEPEKLKAEIKRRDNERRNKIHRFEEKVIAVYNGRNKVIRRRKESI